MKGVMSTYGKLFLALAFIFAMGVIVLVGISEITIAQPGLPNDPEQTPIDGGLGILAALGGAYAIKKLRQKKDV